MHLNGGIALPNKPRLTVTTGDWSTLATHALPVRLSVFVREQLVPLEMEVDQWDRLALHVVVFDHAGTGLATGRLTAENSGVGSETTPLAGAAGGVGRIGRVAVLSTYRGQGLGALVMKTLIQAASDQGFEVLTLHAQHQAVAFYEKFGFIAAGNLFEEAGIPHVEMWR